MTVRTTGGQAGAARGRAAASRPSGGWSLDPPEIQELHRAITARITEKGWRLRGHRTELTYPSSSLYAMRDVLKDPGRPKRVWGSSLPLWDARMEWYPTSSLRAARRLAAPLPVEEVAARLVKAIGDLCAGRGWDPAARVGAGLWDGLCAGTPPLTPAGLDADGRVDGRGRLLDPAVAAAVEAAMEWPAGETARVALREYADPPAAPPAGPGDEGADRVYAVIERLRGTVAAMSPPQREKVARAVQDVMLAWVKGEYGE